MVTVLESNPIVPTAFEVSIISLEALIAFTRTYFDHTLLGNMNLSRLGPALK